MAPASSRRRTLLWGAWGGIVAVTVLGGAGAFRLLVGHPSTFGYVALAFVAVPLGLGLSLVPAARAHTEGVVVVTVVIAGLAALVLAVYVIVVVGLGSTPSGTERHVLGLSMVAAGIAVVLAEPARVRLVATARRWTGGGEVERSTALDTFGARMTRAVAMDELLLQLAEVLRSSIAPAGAEVWTGTGGLLDLAVAVPDRARPRMALGEQEAAVAARTRVGGNAWIGVWLPELLTGRESAQVRVAPVAHLGELLGLLVVLRDASDRPFDDDDERPLAELARQVGLALHNVRLDSALQQSLLELQQRNVELQESRARIVAASDASRRQIERNLHDGAQQHLVALAVKLGLAKQIAGDAPPEVLTLLDELRADVQTTIGELRELAHGIYPPLLRDRGLPEALRTAAMRNPLPATVDADLTARYPAEAEAAVYFCCLEAMQNAGKHAEGAALCVTVAATEGGLQFSVSDDGPGFDGNGTDLGQGFTNMADRLGAMGGTLTVRSAPGAGTTVSGDVPCAPLGTTPFRGAA
ncbi:MAG TPA: histidine kinase [Mycobacteriales bacterium]|nr:histidine kinase [Mycobacteriales bacterium]